MGVFCQCVLVLFVCKLLVAFTRKTGVCVGSLIFGRQVCRTVASVGPSIGAPDGVCVFKITRILRGT